MKRWRQYVWSAALIGLISWTLVSCSQAPKQQPAATQTKQETAAPAPAPAKVTNEAGVEQKTLPPAPPPKVENATITFLTGDVQVEKSKNWIPANIGDTVSASENLRVGAASYCEIQFGNLAVARIEANSEVSISQLALGKTRQVGIALAAGAVVSKVQKLAGNDEYQVGTQTAVAGVRGTEFRVATSKSNETELSVREGVVTVIPPQAIIQTSTPEQAAVAQEVKKTVVASAPTVTADQQLVVTSSDFAPAREQLAKVKQQIDSGATTATVKSLVDQTVAAASRSVPKPAPISTEQQKALAVTASMQLLPTEAPPAASQSTGTTAAPQPPKPTTVPFSVSVEPSQAEIYLDDSLVGTQGFSGLFVPGKQVTLSLRLKGYETKTIPVTVPDSGVALNVTLTQSPEQPQTPPAAKSEQPKAQAAQPAPQTAAKTAPQPTPKPQPTPAPAPAKVSVSINAVPSNAQISVNGSRVGVGSYQGTYTEGEQITVDVQANGYNSESRTVVVNKNTGNLAFRLARQIQYGTVSFTTSPSNAAIYVNGSYVGTGSYSSKYQENSSVQVRASLRGYADASSTVTVAADSTTSRNLVLKPQPIEGTFNVSSSALIRSLAVASNQIISVDKGGVIRSTSGSGATNWQVSSGNSSNENSQPVVADGIVFLTGARDFVGVDVASGTELFKVSLGQSNAHLFGRSVAVSNGEVYYPTDNAIQVYGERTGKVVRTINLPSASNMSVLVASGNFLIVDQQGTLYELNAQNGQVLKKIGSSAVQPVAISPVMQANNVFFVGRRGTAVLADLSAGKVSWQKPLDPSQSMGVFTNPVFGSRGVYVFAKNTLFGLSTSNGSNLFAPVKNVSASPLVDGSSLYYGTTDGKLVKANAATGAIEASVSVGGKITTRPVVFGQDIAVGTASGQIVLVYPATMGAAQ